MRWSPPADAARLTVSATAAPSALDHCWYSPTGGRMNEAEDPVGRGDGLEQAALPGQDDGSVALHQGDPEPAVDAGGEAAGGVEQVVGALELPLGGQHRGVGSGGGEADLGGVGRVGEPGHPAGDVAVAAESEPDVEQGELEPVEPVGGAGGSAHGRARARACGAPGSPGGGGAAKTPPRLASGSGAPNGPGAPRSVGGAGLGGGARCGAAPAGGSGGGGFRPTAIERPCSRYTAAASYRSTARMGGADLQEDLGDQLDRARPR